MRKHLITLATITLPNPLRVRLVILYQHLTNFLKYGDWWFPRSIAMEISRYCNRTCRYCPNVSNKTPVQYMDMDLIRLALLRMREIGWSGPVDYNFYNEPTLDRRLPRIVSLTKQIVPNAFPRVVTNGDFLTEPFVREMIDRGVVYFGVTRHPPFSAAWDAKMRNLRSVFPNNITFGQIWDPDQPDDPKELSNRGGAVFIPGYRGLKKCDEPSQGLNILMDGSVVICCADYHRTTAGRFGNIKDQGLLQIWRHPEFVRLRRNLLRDRVELPICRRCFATNLPLQTGRCRMVVRRREEMAVRE